jgi:hypothetical protein
MAPAICGPKVSSAQCFRRIATETWRVAAHGQWAGGGRKLATGALSGRIWRKLQRGAAPAGFSELRRLQRIEKASPNWGRFIAMSAYRGGMSEAGFTRMLDPAAVPMIFAGWAARFVAAR